MGAQKICWNETSLVQCRDAYRVAFFSLFVLHDMLIVYLLRQTVEPLLDSVSLSSCLKFFPRNSGLKPNPSMKTLR